MEFLWGHERRFNSWTQYCISEWGTRLQKLCIDAGFSCPNRDGKIDTKGCTYCLNDAFNPSYCTPTKTIAQQLDEGIEFHKGRYKKAQKYIAYFQPYSNTYKPIEKLRDIYVIALSHPAISGLCISTRPDCIENETITFLNKLSKKYFIFLEIGIESCFDATLEKINRGHTFAKSEETIRKLKEAELHTNAHLIFGLPGETRNQMLATAEIISKLPIDSLKLHQLQIIKGTQMAKEYQEHPEIFTIFELDKYIDFVIDFLEILRADIKIERLCAEVPPPYLITTNWGLLRNDQVIRKIEKRMQERDTWQGKFS